MPAANAVKDAKALSYRARGWTYHQIAAEMGYHDRSAARGEMATRGLYVFEHDSELGNAHAHSLFERIVPRLKDGVATPRSFADYEVAVNEADLPPGVKLHRRVG